MLPRVAALGVLLLAVGPCLAQDSVADWLAKMTSSHRQLDYRGILTYQHADQIRNYRIKHFVLGGSEYESVETLDGPEEQLVRRGHDANCVHSGPQLLQHFGDEDGRGLHRYYDVNLTGSGRVADREVVTLEIRPKDVYRLGYLLSLDHETGLLLRSDIVDQQERVLERFQYAVLQLGPEPGTGDANLASMPADPVLGLSKLAMADSALPVQRRWKPSWLPAGFAEASPDNVDAAGLSYTDGLAVFSVFVETLTPNAQGELMASEGSRRRGASVSYSAVFPDRRSLVMVVGEVPLLTARQVAKSVVWTD